MNQRRTGALIALTGVAAMSAWPVFASVAQAASTPHYQMQKKAIVLNGKTVTQPYGFAYNNTMYMPIWYVMNTLEQLGIKSTWNHNVWNMTVPSSFSVDTSNIQVGTGQISLEINGKLMHKVNGIAAIDPSTGKPTTFIPIWYTQQLLERVGIDSPWDGTTWVLKNAVQPQPKLPANEVATWQFLQGVEKQFGVTPSSTGASKYDDIASSDSHWGIVQSAIAKGIYQPPSATHSGAYAAIDAKTADTILWNAFGLKNGAFQPGADPSDWANIVGLNPSGIQSTDLLTPQELTEIMSNLADNQQGFRVTGANSYQIDYPIEDEATATFTGATSSGKPFFPSNQDVQAAITNTYQFYDGMHLTNESGTWVLSIPSLSGTKWFSYTSTLGDVQYQLPGDSTWQSASTLDSRELQVSPTDQIRIRIPQDNGLTITMNQMLPDFGGTVTLGSLDIELGTGGPVVHRVDITQ
ncbi:hypothetical protein [Alicyclobacillus dauci]|uniref:Copper amine oxidase N-terminal domain-containing protein n=1 Tax=Alicyclobacillus dauci TaxID=1475485 RepID=A0ABY6Z2G7_9BACL|nr:hypothetical protein [Alicyclobacillus dauci]WAH36708.1 hypothetical protein NZD86_21455 [Alicyclobacillus dauci]